MSLELSSNELTLPGGVGLYPHAEDTEHRRFDDEVIADGRYTVAKDGLIAARNFTDVYRAVDNLDPSGSEVAIKVYRETTPEFSEMVRRELSAHITLNGMAGLVQARGMGIINEGFAPQHYLTVDLWEEDLREPIIEGHMDMDTILGMTSQVLQGLASIHEQGFVHNDVKPSNILGRNHGSEWVLTDFGLVSATNELLREMPDKEALSIWEPDTSRSVRGTAGFIAPELIVTENPGLVFITPKVDVFSVGVTLFNATSGELPFDSTSLASYQVSVTKDSPANMESVRRALPAQLGDLAMDCLEVCPDNRPTTQELIEAFAAV